MGYVHLYDIDTVSCLYMNRVSETTPFVSVPHTATGGLLMINRRGQALLVTILADAVVPYVMHTLKNVELATVLASRNAFPGAENIFVEQFEELFEEEQYREAALVAAESPGGVLRTGQTIAKFKSAPADGAGPSPLMIYFTTLLERGRLNRIEALELAFLMSQYVFSSISLVCSTLRLQVHSRHVAGSCLRSPTQPRRITPLTPLCRPRACVLSFSSFFSHIGILVDCGGQAREGTIDGKVVEGGQTGVQ